MDEVEERLENCTTSTKEVLYRIEKLQKRIEKLEKHGLTEYEFGTSNVTIEDIDKAEADAVRATAAADVAYAAASAKADDATAAADRYWELKKAFDATAAADRYWELKKAFENG